MAHDLIPMLAIIGTFGSIITFIYMRYTTRHAERMSLIESGQTAEILEEKGYSNSERGLKTGLFFIGGGIGFVLGGIIEKMLQVDHPAATVPLAIVGAGTGLVIFYQMMKSKEVK